MADYADLLKAEKKVESTPIPSKEITKPVVTEKKERSDKKDSSIASTHASLQASNKDAVENIRKAVKKVGKEVSFIRLTPEEKKQLTDIAYIYKSGGIKTSENEISRIGINYMLEDYHANGENSILARVIEALNA